jgi:molybdenum cofactor cytidylyltransferase
MNGRINPRVGAVVLAAGSSSRMGKPKQLLPLAGTTVLEQTLQNLRAAHVDEIVLVLGSSAEIIERQLSTSSIKNLKILVNPDYSQGMASSLSVGLSATASEIDAALIVLADQPFIQPETFNRIIDRYHHSEAQIIIPAYRGFRGNPVLLDRSVFDEVMALKGDIGCRAIFGDHSDRIVKVEVDDIGVLLDIDNREDYERLRVFGRTGQDETTLVQTATQEAREMPKLRTPGDHDASREDQLIIVGWEPISNALAKLGKLLGFTVTIVDPLIKNSDLPEGTSVLSALDFSQLQNRTNLHVVIASRGRFDEEAIEQALKSKTEYIGLVANRKRGQELLRRLQNRGEHAERLATIHVPAGLDIGARTAEEIALSIMAEIVSQRAGKTTS